MRALRHRRRAHAARLAGALLFSTALVSVSAPPVFAASPTHSGVAYRTKPAPRAKPKPATFGIGPASAHGIDGRPFLNFATDPGATTVDHVGIVNVATKPIRISVYAADTVTADDGSIGYAPRAATPRDAGAWLHIDLPHRATSVLVPARHTVVVPISVIVPKSAQPGDHAAGVIASVTSRVTSKSGKRVNFEQRVALRTYFRVSGDLQAQLAIVHLHASYSGTQNPVGTGAVTVSYTVMNKGNVRLGAKQHVDVSGLFASDAAKPQPPTIPLLLPGASAKVSTTIHGVFPQVYLSAHVRLSPLLIAGDADPRIPSQYANSVTVWAIPWTLLAIVVALLALAGWRVWRRRRSIAAGTTDPPEPAPSKTPEGVRS